MFSWDLQPGKLFKVITVVCVRQILKNNADGTDKGSLLWLMDHTHTAFGARLLRHWVNLLKLSIVLRDHVMKAWGCMFWALYHKIIYTHCRKLMKSVQSDCCMLLPCSYSIMPRHGHHIITTALGMLCWSRFNLE